MVPAPYIDTNILIRFLTRDDPEKGAAAAALLARVERGELTVAAPEAVVADAIFVLASRRLYNLPRPHVAALLVPLLRLPGFRVENRRMLLRALAIFGSTTKLDFGDCCIVASMELSGATRLYSYDTDFDLVPDITRVEP